MRCTIHNPSLARAKCASTSGFSVLEVAIAMVILAIAIGGLVAATTSSYTLSRSNQSRSAAHEAAREKIEEIRSADPALVFALYNDDPNDDPAGVGTAPGSGFDVPGLSARPDDLDGRVGRVFFPVDAGGTLREDTLLSSLDMPRDLNLDGIIDANNRAADYALLPVGVALDWRGPKAFGHMELHVLLMAVR